MVKRQAIVWFAFLSLLTVNFCFADDADPPGRVAFISFMNGQVSLEPAGMQDWAAASLNRPLTTGDKLWADQDSRVELDFGAAVVRLGSMTGFSFLNLDDQTAQMNVTAGTAIVHVRDLGDNQANQSIEIDTPNLAVTVQSPGDYRVEVNDSGDTTVVKVSDGQAQITASGQTVPMHTQQAYTFTGTDQVSVDPGSVGTPDVLDQWALDRDHQEEQGQVASNQYVPPDMAGANDLSNYGTWQDTPDYGNVWTPSQVPADWAPYQNGNWVWVAPWGWTWVDQAPWGFAPFHYGRWAYYGSRWCWVPGPRQVRPVYAPALVAWVGSPVAGVAFSTGARGNVGWFPLGPREVFVPGYHVSPAYVRNVNVTNTIVSTTYVTNVYENRVTNITYVNRNRPGAVVTVPQSVFTSSQPVRGNTVRVPPNELAQLGSHGAAPAIVPVRESVLGRPSNANVRRPPAAFVNRPVVARIAPPPAPVPFERQQQAIRANGNRPLARSQIIEMQPRGTNSQVRVVTPGPIRPLPGGINQNNANRYPMGRPQPSREPTIQERERALHQTPIPPAPQNAFRNDRPAVPEARPYQTPGDASGFRNDRPPQVRQAPEAHPLPQAHPIPEAHPIPQAYPVEQQRPVEQYRPAEPAHQQEYVRPAPQVRPVEPQQTRPEAHPIEQPRPAPQQPQGRPSPPPPQAQHQEQRGGRPGPDPRNRQ